MDMLKNRHGAMEMSVGTIVTIVLLMTVLILGIFLVQRIFQSGSNAIDIIDNEVQSEISKLFAVEGRNLAVYPTSRDITLRKGDDPKGFAFSVKNNEVDGADFSFTTIATDVSQCGSTFTEERANSYLLGGSGSFSLGGGNSLELPRLVRFVLPDTAPPCTIVYTLDIKKGDESYATADVFVTIR